MQRRQRGPGRPCAATPRSKTARRSHFHRARSSRVPRPCRLQCTLAAVLLTALGQSMPWWQRTLCGLQRVGVCELTGVRRAVTALAAWSRALLTTAPIAATQGVLCKVAHICTHPPSRPPPPAPDCCCCRHPGAPTARPNALRQPQPLEEGGHRVQAHRMAVCSRGAVCILGKGDAAFCGPSLRWRL